MSILKTRYERATDPTCRASSFVQGGRLVRIASAGATPHKPNVEHTAGSSDRAIGAAGQDALAGNDVVVTHRGWMLLTASGAIAANSDVYPAANGMVQNVGAPAAADKPFGLALHDSPGTQPAGADTVGDRLVWVKPYWR